MKRLTIRGAVNSFTGYGQILFTVRSAMVWQGKAWRGLLWSGVVSFL